MCLSAQHAKTDVNDEQKSEAIESGLDVPVVKVLGWPLFSGGVPALVDRIWEQGKERNTATFVACLNPHSLMLAEHDGAFQTALRSATYLIPDGVGLSLAAFFLGLPRVKRITGSDLFDAAMTSASTLNRSVFFLGSSPGALDVITQKVGVDYPGISRIGGYAPPFKDEFSGRDNDIILERIASFSPDVLWVGMTSPKQDLWIHQNIDKLSVTLVAGIGAVFDFYSGNVPRAPALIRYIGCEWVYRALLEPRRVGLKRGQNSLRFICRVMTKYIQDRKSRD